MWRPGRILAQMRRVRTFMASRLFVVRLCPQAGRNGRIHRAPSWRSPRYAASPLSNGRAVVRRIVAGGRGFSSDWFCVSFWRVDSCASRSFPSTVVRLAVGVALVASCAHTWLMMGLVVPVTVAGSSMAPTSTARTRSIAATVCEQAFSVGLDQASPEMAAVLSALWKSF